MKTNVQYRRKREGKTNYRKRLQLLLSNRPRLVVRKSNKNITCQLIDYHESGDVVLCSADSTQLKRFGWKTARGNISAAYLTGYMLGKKAKSKKLTEGVLDIGLYKVTKGSRLFAAVKGTIDAGMKIACDAEILPSQERITGQHLKNKDFPKYFETVKEQIK